MIGIDNLATYIAACIALVIIPGPSVTVIIANSLRHGSKAGLLNVAGTQLGLAMMVTILALGLTAVIASMGAIFDWLRLAGALYLIWLGLKLWRSDGTMDVAETAQPGGHFFRQGFLVIWSNPKALFFFGAFIPQFIDLSGNIVAQTLLLGLIFMAIATVLDGAYALAAGRAGHWLSNRRVRLMERVSGSFLIGGGLWLALSKR